MIERCMCGYPPIILVHLSVGARAFSIILSGAHHQQNNIMLWINQSLIYVLSQEKNTKWNRNRFRSYIHTFFLFLLLLGLCCALSKTPSNKSWGWLVSFWVVLYQLPKHSNNKYFGLVGSSIQTNILLIEAGRVRLTFFPFAL